VFLFELLVALVIALVLSSILFGVGWEQPYREDTWGGLIAWFIILLLVVWVGGTWMAPFGPRLWDVAWLPFLITGIFIFLLLLIAVPATRYWPRPRTRREAIEQAEMAREEEAVVIRAFGCLFWLLIGLLIIALLSRYTIYPRPVLPPAAASLEPGNDAVATLASSAFSE
jgi:hypothetical protein